MKKRKEKEIKSTRKNKKLSIEKRIKLIFIK